MWIAEWLAELDLSGGQMAFWFGLVPFLVVAAITIWAMARESKEEDDESEESSFLFRIANLIGRMWRGIMRAFSNI